jgi:hypothetical protein
VLCAQASQASPSIELAWNLASGHYAYLEYAADEVEKYETIISQLPGFKREDSQTYILVDDNFKKEHATQLLEAMLDLQLVASN